MKKTLSLILLTAVTVFNMTVPNTYGATAGSAATVPTPLDPTALTAQGATVIDADTGQILYSKNADAVLFPASTTKALTALIIAEDLKMDEVVTIDKESPYTTGSRIYVIEGETFTVEQLLYAMLLESANDAAVALAKYHSGTVEQFAVKMNERAKALGATHSNFLNPNGLPNEKHVTTAHDLALIGQAFSKQPKLMEIAKTYKFDLPPTNKQPEVRHLFSSNKFLFGTGSKNKININGQSIDIKWDAVTGLKTGYTNAAQQCMITSATKDGRNLVSVVLKASGLNLYADSRKLLEYGFNNYKSFTFATSGQLIKTIEVSGEKKSKIDLYTSKDVKALIPISADETAVTSEVTPLADIKLPVTAGQVLGTLKLAYEGQVLSESDLVSMGNISNQATLGSDTKKYINWLPIDQSPKGLTILGAKLVAAFVLWRLIMNKLSGKKKKRKKNVKRPQRQGSPNPQHRGVPNPEWQSSASRQTQRPLSNMEMQRAGQSSNGQPSYRPRPQSQYSQNQPQPQSSQRPQPQPQARPQSRQNTKTVNTRERTR